jgi:hypothetical protein
MGYAATQVLAIRKLLDRRSDVISLQRLLTDIKGHQQLLTREVYVGYDGKPYDPDGWMSLPPTAETQIWGVDAPGLNNYLMATIRHETFDKLSGVPTSARSRTDLISMGIFDKLQGWLRSVEAEKLILLSHKFFAHAASSDNLGSVTDSGVLLSDIERAQRAIVRVERAITDDLLTMGVARNVVAMQPLGFLNGLDAPYVTPETITEMDKHWDALEAERNTWSHGYENELYQ